MATTATRTYRDQFAAARQAAAKASKALEKAIADSRPLPADLHLRALENPEGYAKMVRAQADIIATIPALREAVTAADAEVYRLGQRACWYCDGSGDYQAPTSHYQNGRPTCWKCGGSGENAASRKAK